MAVVVAAEAEAVAGTGNSNFERDETSYDILKMEKRDAADES